MQNAPEIQPIPTRFKGVLYRSRTEARWAVFFDHLGVAATYEPESYNLDGAYYLPDFGVEAWNAFFEVKPGSGPTPYEQERCRKLSDLARKTVFLASGAPGEHWLDVYFPPEWGWGPNASGKGRFAQCRRCEGYAFEYSLWDGCGYGAILLGPHTDWDRCGEKLGGLDLDDAIAAARDERFGIYPAKKRVLSSAEWRAQFKDR